MSFKVHNIDSAPEAAKSALKSVQGKYGFIPNVLAELAEAPATLQAYLQLSELYAQTSLTPEEREVVLLVASRANNCNYCVAAHSTTSAKVLTKETISALRDNKPLPDKKLNALSKFVESLVSNQGWPQDAALKEFTDAGYSNKTLFEVILGISMKTISTYSNHAAKTPLDSKFAAQEWKKSKKAA